MTTLLDRRKIKYVPQARTSPLVEEKVDLNCGLSLPLDWKSSIG